MAKRKVLHCRWIPVNVENFFRTFIQRTPQSDSDLFSFCQVSAGISIIIDLLAV